MKTQSEIVDETIAFYQVNPRSLNPDKNEYEARCLYNGPNGTVCAFSRCVIPEKRKELPEGEGCWAILHKSGDEILIPEYRGHEISFWEAIQSLHDDNEYWKANTLTQMGKERIERIKIGVYTY
jgi:hypothetical protein